MSTHLLMRTQWLTALPAALLSLLLTACGSSPANNYYVLSAHQFPPPSGALPSLGVGPITVPEYLHRDNVAYRHTDNSVQIAGVDLWAEPLEDGMQRVLLLNLAGLLNTQDVSSYPWQVQRAPAYAVKVNVLQLESDARQALLTAEWQVYRPQGSTSVARRISQLQVPLTPDVAAPEQLAAAYSALLFQLSEAIAAAIRTDTEMTPAPGNR